MYLNLREKQRRPGSGMLNLAQEAKALAARTESSLAEHP